MSTSAFEWKRYCSFMDWQLQFVRALNHGSGLFLLPPPRE
jgi:hypothetical protein